MTAMQKPCLHPDDGFGIKVTMYNSINVFAGNFATLYLRNYNRYQSETSCIPTFQHHMKEV